MKSNGIIRQLKDKKVATETTDGPTLKQFTEWINEIAKCRPTKKKPFILVTGGYTFKNDGEFLYIATDYGNGPTFEYTWAKIDREAFINKEIKFI